MLHRALLDFTFYSLVISIWLGIKGANGVEGIVDERHYPPQLAFSLHVVWRSRVPMQVHYGLEKKTQGDNAAEQNKG